MQTPEPTLQPGKARRLAWRCFIFLLLCCLGFGAWLNISYTKQWVEHQLSRERQLGVWRLHTWGFRWDGYLRPHWDGLLLVSEHAQIRLDSVDLRIFPFAVSAEQRALRLHVDRLQVRLSPQGDTSAFAWPRLAFPQIQFPLQIEALVEFLQVEANDTMRWHAHAGNLRTTSRTGAILTLEGVQGNFLPQPLSLALSSEWGKGVLDASADIFSNGDSLHLVAEAPLDNLLDANAQVEMRLRDISLWAPLPSNIPRLTRLQLQAGIDVLPERRDIQWRGQLNVESAPLWQIPRLRWKASPQGNLRGNMRVSLESSSPDGMHLSGNAERQASGKINATASLRHFSLQLGKHILPADLDLESLQWDNQNLSLQIRTINGSEIQAMIRNPLAPDPLVQFQVQASSVEPWALIWTGNQLRPQGYTHLVGTYENKTMRGTLSTSLPYAFNARADSLHAEVILNSVGINFPNATIISRNEKYRVNGQVLWGVPEGVLFVHLQQSGGGQAQLAGNLQGKLRLEIDSLQLYRLPLAKTDTPLEHLRGSLNGTWEQDFSSRTGKLELQTSALIHNRSLGIQAQARQSGDTLEITHIELTQNINKIQGRGFALYPTQTQENATLQVMEAQVEARNFDLSAVADITGKTPFKQGLLDGLLYYNVSNGFGGRLEIRRVTLSTVDSSLLSIPRLFLHAHRNQLQLMARIKAGLLGEWDGDAEIILFDPLGEQQRLSGAAALDHGGTFWFQAKRENRLNWSASVEAEGPWALPQGSGEIDKLRFTSQWNIAPKNGLRGVSGNFRADTLELKLGNMVHLPLHVEGSLREGLLELPRILLRNTKGDSLHGHLALNLQSGQMQNVGFFSRQYRLFLNKEHVVEARELSGKAHYQGNDLLLKIISPHVAYNMDNARSGANAHARAQANLVLRLPGKDELRHSQSNPSLEGRVDLERMLYRQDFDLRAETRNITRFLNLLTGFFRDIGKEKPQHGRQQKPSGGRPLELRIHISDTGRDSVAVLTDLASFPLTVDLHIGGTTANPVLEGDINASGTGKLDMAGLATFDIQSLRVNWPSVTLRRGNLEMSSSKTLPYCEEARRQQTCPINFHLKGPLTKPTPIPEAECGTESTPAAIYYSILLGCIPNTLEGENIDGRREADKLAGRLLGGVISQLVNQGLGGDYLRNVSLKWRYFEEGNTDMRDSNYIRIPVSMDHWVPNLSFVMAYAEDVSLNPRYNRSMEVGLGYILPLFDSTDIHINHLEPTVNMSGALVARRYHTEVGSNDRTQNLELNAGIAYTFRFWEPCLLGFGQCSNRSHRPEEMERE